MVLKLFEPSNTSEQTKTSEYHLTNKANYSKQLFFFFLKEKFAIITEFL